MLLTAFSIAAKGYHYATDDGGLYIPAILQRLHPSLYAFDRTFVCVQTGYSVYATVASGLASCLGGSVPASVFLLHCVGTFTLLAAALQLALAMFNSQRAAWCAVSVLACSTAIFVAGTSIPIMDPYFTPRTLSTPLSLLVVNCLVARKWLAWACGLGCIFAVHPLMGLYAGFFCACYWIVGFLPISNPRLTASLSILPVIPGTVNDSARQTLLMPNHHFFLAWRWSVFDWIGVVVPLAIYFFLWRVPVRVTRSPLRRISAAALLCGTAATLFFLTISFSADLESAARLQPMRSFHLLYTILFLIVGGLVGEYVLRERIWRWSLLFVALAAMDFAIDHAVYAASAHMEWPTAPSKNKWLEAFEWVRLQTPENAVFALSPEYINAVGEDRHGFRAMAQRSALEDEEKDSGVVAMLPSLAPEWQRQVRLRSNWATFTAADFQGLARQYPVRWVVVELKQARALDCPYRNATVAVCQISP